MEGLFLIMVFFPMAGALVSYLADRKAGGKNVRDAAAILTGVIIFAVMCVLACSGRGSELYVPDRKSVV